MEFLLILIVLVVVFVVGRSLLRYSERMNRPPPLSGIPDTSSELEHLSRDLDATLGFVGRAVGKATGSVVHNARKAYGAESSPVVAGNAASGAGNLGKYEALEKLQSLLDKGTISRDEFEAEKKNILG